MKNPLPQFRLLGLLAAFALAGTVAAHDNAELATLKAPHGGQLKVAGDWHLELVQKPGGPADANTLLVYVTDHDGRPVSSAGLKATATILAGKNKLNAAFAPDGDNRLKTTARYDRGAQAKIVVSVSGNGKTEQARFVP